MIKISTLFKKDQNDLSRVTSEIDSQNEWVLTSGIPTRKYDGTACAIINGELYKRYDAKKGRQAPVGAIPCQEADEHGHHPHWVKITPQDKYHIEAFDRLENKTDGTYELCGPKINNNREKFDNHVLVKHASVTFYFDGPITYDNIKRILESADIEGIVFHEISGSRMCKIRKTDFGIRR